VQRRHLQRLSSPLSLEHFDRGAADLRQEAQGNFVNRYAELCGSGCNDGSRQLFVEAQAEDVNQDVRRPIQRSPYVRQVPRPHRQAPEAGEFVTGLSGAYGIRPF
jgi:hypothetical protein